MLLSNEYLWWVSLRSVRVSKLTIRANTSVGIFSSYAQRFGENITCVRMINIIDTFPSLVFALFNYCNKLTTLTLLSCWIDETVSTLLSAACSLTDLRIRNCTVTATRSFLDNVSCRSLNSLTLFGFSFDNSSTAKFVAAGSNLAGLNIAHCYNLSPSRVVPLMQSCRNMIRLCLSGQSQLGDATLVEIVRTCRLLVHLDVSQCPCVRSVGIAAVAEALVYLRTLNAEGTKTTNAALRHLVTHRAATLEHLYVADCTSINAVGLAVVLERCLVLRALSASCHYADITKLHPRLLQGITMLKLRGRDAVSNTMLLHVALHCTHLQHLSLGQERGGAMEVANGLYALAVHRPSLHALATQPGSYFLAVAVAHFKVLRPHVRVTGNFTPPFFHAGFDTEF